MEQLWTDTGSVRLSATFDARLRLQSIALRDGRKKPSDHAIGRLDPIRHGQKRLEHSAVEVDGLGAAEHCLAAENEAFESDK